MAFSFGNSNQSTFGSPNKQTSQINTTNFGSTFGQSQQQQPQTQTTFGSSFGTQPAVGATAPTFGTSFGVSQPSFGQTTQTFGSPQTSSMFGPSFGSTSFNSSFGQPTQQNMFGTSTTQAPTNTFGQPTTASMFMQQPNTGLFSTPNTTLGSNFGTTGLFGGATSGSSPFGNGFGTTPISVGFGFGSSFGGFSNTPNLTSANTSNKPINASRMQVLNSIYAVSLYNDERDDIIKKWNMVQACWGVGKGYYSSMMPPCEYTPQNPFCWFKTVSYNRIPDHDNSEGYVKLVFNKKCGDLKNQIPALKNGIVGILGNKPNLTVEIVSMKSISNHQTEVKIFVYEKSVTGYNRRIPASDLASFLNQPPQKQQLSNVGVIFITPCITPSRAELEEYLKYPPSDIDMKMWHAAIRHNPDPRNYIPVPINGFSDLHKRMIHQYYEVGLHKAFLEKVTEDIVTLQNKHVASIAQITALKQRFLELEHRILKVLVKQETVRSVGIPIVPEERSRIEALHSLVNNPHLYRGKIDELLASINTFSTRSSQKNEITINIGPTFGKDLKDFLTTQQHSIQQLTNLVHNDMKALQICIHDLKTRKGTVRVHIPRRRKFWCISDDEPFSINNAVMNQFFHYQDSSKYSRGTDPTYSLRYPPLEDILK